jgi:thiamine-monophosphate kinase
VRVGVGDDAAVLAPPRGEDLVATVDEVTEGVHFDGRFRPFDVGWKALAVNLSDLAAMGARPLWALVALEIPPEAAGEANAMARGLAACARRCAPGLAVVGGNVSRAAARSLVVTVLGAVARGRALLRSGARPGDLVAVTGTLGDAALGRAPGAARALARRQRRPLPRLAAGRALAGIARAAIDVSDGLVRDLGHVCRASGVSADVDLAALPVSAAYRRAVRGAAQPWAAALAGGEDYELVVAVPPGRRGEAAVAARRAGVTLTVIGRFGRGSGVTVRDASGRKVRAPEGHDHLRRAAAPGGGRVSQSRGVD